MCSRYERVLETFLFLCAFAQNKTGQLMLAEARQRLCLPSSRCVEGELLEQKQEQAQPTHLHCPPAALHLREGDSKLPSGKHSLSPAQRYLNELSVCKPHDSKGILYAAFSGLFLSSSCMSRSSASQLRR